MMDATSMDSIRELTGCEARGCELVVTFRTDGAGYQVSHRLPLPSEWTSAIVAYYGRSTLPLDVVDKIIDRVREWHGPVATTDAEYAAAFDYAVSWA